MASSEGDRDTRDRTALLRRIGWERTSFRLVRLAVALLFIVGGLISLASADRSRLDGLVPLGLGLVLLWELRRSAGMPPAPTPLTSAQTRVLAATLARDGRLAAVRELRGWTGASYGEATRDIDAAFPVETPPQRSA